MPIARAAPNDCARRTSSAASAASLVVAAELGQRERCRRSPRQQGRVLAAKRRVVERAAPQLLDRRFVVAGRGAKHARGVAQLGARHELGVVANAGAVDEPAQGVGGLVALEAREHRRRHRQDEELGAEQVGGELDRRLRVRLGGGQVSAAHGDRAPEAPTSSRP